ncbi:MAG TPA: SRPBCC family protein [Burkholderiaceae bacterium]|nr:SRPBCC family protein [Burkholderiaceae bacterium]
MPSPVIASAARRYLTRIAPLAVVAFVMTVQAHAEVAPPTNDIDIRVTVERAGETVRIDADATLAASRETAWRVLTDYDHLAEIVPGMRASRVVARDDGRVIVEQQGYVGVLFFKREFALTLASNEQPMSAIDLTLVTSNGFASFDARYALQELDASRVRIAYRARFVPKPLLAPPPVVGLAVMRRQVRTQFEAVVREIARRHAARESTGSRF